uniref:PhoH family protein n=1 Tax=Ignisphaera aggregans TaxID=334771 RepID=A0A7C2VNW6_9CREN
MAVLENLRPLTPGQEEMYNALKDRTYEILGFFGPTGTGKSLFSLAYGIDGLLNNEYSRFIIIRPLVDVVTGQEIDAAKSPEAFAETMKNYIRDIIGNYIEWHKIESLIADGKIVLSDPRYLRGRSFDNAIVFLDDIQLMKPESIIEAVIRVGKNSRLIVAGDPVFQAIREVEQDPAAVIREVLLSEEKSYVVDLGIKDIVREGAKRGLRFLLEYKLRSRSLSEEEKRIYDIVKAKSPDADIITVIDLTEAKKAYEISQDYVPDSLIIVKQGHMGRLVGRGGERINNAEKELGKRLRGVELNLDFKDMVRALHPTSWIWKHITEVDFAGPNLQIKVYEDVIGPAVGQRGSYVRFLDTVFRRLIGVGVRIVAVEREKKKRK